MRDKMKWTVVFLFCSCLFLACETTALEKCDNVKITQTYFDGFYGERVSAVIFEVSKDAAGDLVAAVAHSKTICTGQCVKEALNDGEFSIVFFKNNAVVLDFTVFNSQNAFDELTGEFKKIRAIDMIPNKIPVSFSKNATRRRDFYRNCSEMTIKTIFGDAIKEESPFLCANEYFPEVDGGAQTRVLRCEKKGKTAFLLLIKNCDEWRCASSIEFSGAP